MKRTDKEEPNKKRTDADEKPAKKYGVIFQPSPSDLEETSEKARDYLFKELQKVIKQSSEDE